VLDETFLSSVSTRKRGQDTLARMPRPADRVERGVALPLLMVSFTLLGPLFGCSPKEPLNVLLISIDTLRFDHLSSYGADRPSPAIDALAARGARFENAFSPSSWTLPAHASMLSGRYPSSINDDPNSLDLFRKSKLLTSILSEHGYQTGAVTGGSYLGSKFGLAEHFDFFDESSATSNVAVAQDWLGKNATKPFFFFFHTYFAHAPYIDRRYVQGMSGGRLQDIYTDGKMNKPHFAVCCEGLETTVAERAFVESLYDGGVAVIDGYVEQLWETLGTLDLQKKTLVIITSDHGEEFWEHTGRGAYHGHTLYDELLRVPLIWVDPQSSKKGSVVTEPVNLIDIVPSLLARLGIKSSEPVDGIDLQPLLATGAWDVDRVLFAEGSRNGPERKSVRSDGAKLIVTPHPSVQGGDGARYPVPVLAPVELYLPGDDAERHNLAQQKGELVRALMERLQSRIQRMPEDHRAGSLEPLDEQTRDQLRTLGYLE
jgi:arylsulfatase A-like enzyme